MKQRIYSALLTLAICCFLQPSQAQQAIVSSKLDLRLFKRLQQGDIRNQNMPLLVRGNQDLIKELTESLKGIYKYGYNGISSVEIPEKNLLAFSNSKAVEKIESTGGKGVFLMDTARIRNNVDSVLGGFAPLVNSLKGKNVVVGIIDGGIYWQHFDFKKPTDSTTRIKYIWDQVATGGITPAPYNYGRQWSSTEINNGTCTHTPPNSDFGHGTCVAGIAAGNSLSTKGTAYQGQFTGVAPEADIIAVRIPSGTGNNFMTKITDAVDYIFKKADSLGKPCVINTSVGDYYGSHDGNDLATQMIDAMITQKNGRVLVAAAGNGGQIPFHLSYNIPTDSAYTLFKYSNSFGGVYFDWWADTVDFKNASFAIGCNAPLTGADSGRTAYLNVPANFNPPPGNSVLNTYNLTSRSGVALGTIDVYAALDDNRYHVEVIVTPANNSFLWRLQTKGTGTFDCWATESLIGTSDMTDYINSVYITDPAYRHPDYFKTMVSAWQNSDKVITVGNYSNRASYLDRDGNTVNLLQSPYFETVGKRFGTSSWGPTRDNRLKPDVMATGSTTICTGDANFIALATAPANRVKVSITLKHIRNGGTSMASPLVAGIAALYLEKYPHASYSEIKQALICTAKSDAFTGITPNYEYGNGKVDAFAAIAHSCIRYGTSDTSCANYNPSANTDTGCVAKIYGIMDTACTNYNPLANTTAGICVPKVYGVMDTACLNYNSLANVSGGVCVPKVYGVMDTACMNYNALANVSGGVCVAKVYGVMDTACMNYNALANVSGGICVPKVYGVMDTACINYNPLANVSGGVCVPKVYGVMDTACMNYNALANVSGGICVPKVYGVMDTACMNYNALANAAGGVCVPKVYGVMDTACMNYNALANVDGGVCVPKVYGVMDTACMNYNALANVDGGVCVPKVYGVMDTACMNYNALANVSGGVCVAKVYGVMDTACINYNALANVDGGICVAKVYGVMDTACMNYNALANVSVGVCVPKVYGVMDTACMNYNSLANIDNGTCVAKIYGVTDTGCINFNPAANIDGGGCMAKVYGATDTTCVNYNALANVNDGSCITSSISVIASQAVSVQVIPNPFRNQTNFILEGLKFTTGRIKIYNQLGEVVDELPLIEGKYQYTYRNDKLAKAIYHYLLLADGKIIKTGKLVVE